MMKFVVEHGIKTEAELQTLASKDDRIVNAVINMSMKGSVMQFINMSHNWGMIF